MKTEEKPFYVRVTGYKYFIFSKDMLVNNFLEQISIYREKLITPILEENLFCLGNPNEFRNTSFSTK